MEESQGPTLTSHNFLKVLVDPDNAQLDVVAVHGLNYNNIRNHAEETWTASNGKMWLRDFLPTQLPRARILLFVYNANVTFTSSTAGVNEQAENLLNRLKLKRKKIPEDRPVMFICYSLGGIIVKRALVDAKLDRTYESIRKLCEIAEASLQNTFKEAFTKDSLFADAITKDFRHQLEDRFVLTFFETQFTRNLGVVVDKKAATLGLPGHRETQLSLDTDHEDICKFRDCSGPDYEQVVGNIKELSEKIIEIASGADPREIVGYEERVRILEWLSDVAVEDHHVFISSDRLVGTGGWLLEKPEFIGWKESEISSVLWLHGIAGAGKSKLASLVIDKFRQTREGEALAYFYCNYKEDNRRDPEYIMRTIIKQLCTMLPELRLPAPVIYHYRRREKNGFLSKLLTLEEIQSLFLGLAANYKKTIICIDALDECYRDTRKKLLFFLNQALALSTSSVKIFVTSRDDHDIKLRLEDSPNVYIRASDNTGDINHFVRTEIERCISDKEILDGLVEPGLKAHIISTLINGAHGMFLWADMQIRVICKERSPGAIERGLKELPKDLDETFSEILRRIEKQPNDDPDIAKKTLELILCAQRPLSSLELIGAVNIKPNQKEWQDDNCWTEKGILDVCQNLLVIDDKSGVLRFAHLSVQDFLKERFKSSHSHVAEICLTLLCWPNYGHEYHKPEESAFTSYSVMNWGTHAQFSEIDGGNTSLVELQKNFLTLSPGFEIWCQRVRKDLKGGSSRVEGISTWLKDCITDNKPGLSSLLLIACHYGLLGTLRFLLGTSANTTPSLSNRASIISRIHSTHDSGGRTLFHYVAARGHGKIIKELLKSIGNSLRPGVPVQNNRAGWLAEKKYSLLVNRQDHYGNTPLHYAAMSGQEGVVKLLLQATMNSNPKYKDGQTLLHCAVRQGYEWLVTLLLKGAADVNYKDDYSWTPLHHAAEKGYAGAIKLLLEVGADVKCVDNGGQTPLHRAAESEYKVAGVREMVKLLLQVEGVDVNLKDSQGSTALKRITNISEKLARKRERLRGREPLLSRERGRLRERQWLLKWERRSERGRGRGRLLFPEGSLGRRRRMWRQERELERERERLLLRLQEWGREWAQVQELMQKSLQVIQLLKDAGAST